MERGTEQDTDRKRRAETRAEAHTTKRAEDQGLEGKQLSLRRIRVQRVSSSGGLRF